MQILNIYKQASNCEFIKLFSTDHSKDGVTSNRQGSYKKRLIVYCMYAWGTPTVAVLACVTVDHVEKGSVGYGKYIFFRNFSNDIIYY